MAATHSTITILYQDQIAFHSLAIDHPSSPQISHRIHIFLFQQVSSSQQKAKKHYRTFRILVAPPKTRICVLVNLFPVAETPINNGISLIGLPREIVQARFFLRRHDLQASLTSSPAAIDMSMGATLGPPPGPPIFERGHTTEPHRNGFGGNGNTSKKSSDRVFPHIDDLVNVRPDVGIHTPMRKLLHAAEDSAKNAETHLDFRRPDYALKEYINALTIVVDIIPRHKEFPDLRTSELYRVFLGVQKRIMAQNAKFEDVKKKIKENNAANGIKPEKEQGFATGRTTVANGSSGMSRADSPQVVNARKVDSSSQSESSQNHRQPRNGESSLDNLQLVRVKPIPGPKPDALHGKSIPHSVSNGIQRISNPPLEDSEARFPPLEDLEARFARLRHTEPRKDAVQDPRIRTRPLGSLDLSDHNRQSLDQTSQLQYKPSGPRDMPKVSSGAPHPSKTPFNLNIPVLLQQPAAIYSPDRSSTEVRNSIPPRPTARNKMSTLTHSTPYNPGAAYKSPHNPMPTTPSTTITSHQLDILLQDEAKSQSLLLVDIRARRDFDEGHIMAPYIICIEPTILRENCSAVDLEEALILAPDYERQLYQNRHQFEKIVYYDQSSISNRYLTVTSNVEEMYLKRFHKAVWEYEYDKRLKGPPLLLIGGLDIWQDVNPQLKLATSTTLPAIEELGPQISIQSTGANKQVSSRLDPTDETSFANEMIDFSKRFPPVLESMSMTDESQLNGTKQVSSTRIGGFGNQTGRSPIPARPQPVLVSGGRNGDWRLGKIGGSKYGSSRIPAKLAHSNRKTGLKNFGNTCYMNSIYQALSATTWLPRYLCEGDFDELGPPPRKEDELSRPPQLMSRNLAYLFAALWSGQHPYISPHQLRNYIFRMSSMGVAGREESALGGNQQQDAQEFLYFLTGILEDENNMARNKKEDGAVSPQEEARYANMDRFDAAQEHWERYLQAHQSRITEKLCGITTSEKRCSNCSHFIRNFSDRWRNLTLPLLTNNDRQQLLDLFAQKFKAELLEDSPCEKCKHKNTTTRKEIFTRLPQTLILVLGRFKSVNGVSTRVSNAVEFNWNELDLTRFFAPTTSEQKAKFGLPDRHRYRCYAVVQHKGASAHRGHYTTLIRDERGSWIEMDDSTWREANPGEISSNKAYILFFEKI